MLYPRFLMHSLMILVLVSALGMTAVLWISRLQWGEIVDIKDHLKSGAFLLAPFLVLLKRGWSAPQDRDD